MKHILTHTLTHILTHTLAHLLKLTVVLVLASPHALAEQAFRKGAGVIDRQGMVWIVQGTEGSSVKVESTRGGFSQSFNAGELTLTTPQYKTPSGNMIRQGDTFIDKDGYTRQISHIDSTGRFVSGYRDDQGRWHQGASPEVEAEGRKRGLSSREISDSSRGRVYYPTDVDYAGNRIKQYVGQIQTPPDKRGFFSRIGDTIERTGQKIAPKVAGRLMTPVDLALITASIASSVSQDEADKAMAKGECPSGAVSFEKLAAVSLPLRDEILADCDRKSKPVVIPASKIDELKSESKVGLSETKCDERGVIQLLHRNGTTTKIEFSTESTIGVIRTETIPGGSGVEYKPGELFEGRKGKVLVYSQQGESRYGQDESWESYLQRSACLFSSCSERDVARFSVRQDDTMGPQRPFGNANGPKTLDVVKASSFVKSLITAAHLRPIDYAGLCEKLGGRAAKNVLFPEIGESASPGHAQGQDRIPKESKLLK